MVGAEVRRRDSGPAGSDRAPAATGGSPPGPGAVSARLKDNAAAIRHYRQGHRAQARAPGAHANIVNAYLDCCDWDAVDSCASSDFLDYRAQSSGRRLGAPTGAVLRDQPVPGRVRRGILAVERAPSIERSLGRDARRRLSSAGRATGTDPRGLRLRRSPRSHAIGHLTAGLYAAHDRAGFEVYAYSMGPDDGSVYRRHIERGCDRFRSTCATRYTGRHRAAHPASDGIDILHRHEGLYRARQAAHLRPPPPLQVSYLGYPGTTGARYIDYFISDRVATPPGHEDEFTEQLVYLPDCYQVNDHHQPSRRVPRPRSDFGLPERRVRLLQLQHAAQDRSQRYSRRGWRSCAPCPSGVLWLHQATIRRPRSNLRAARTAPASIPAASFFAGRLDKAAHLARHRLADLFLDTYCVQRAHHGERRAVGRDCPSSPVPGDTFARRVAASLSPPPGCRS